MGLINETQRKTRMQRTVGDLFEALKSLQSGRNIRHNCVPLQGSLFCIIKFGREGFGQIYSRR